MMVRDEQASGRRQAGEAGRPHILPLWSIEEITPNIFLVISRQGGARITPMARRNRLSSADGSSSSPLSTLPLLLLILLGCSFALAVAASLEDSSTSDSFYLKRGVQQSDDGSGDSVILIGKFKFTSSVGILIGAGLCTPLRLSLFSILTKLYLHNVIPTFVKVNISVWTR